MGTMDIIARLQLRAEQFSSETGRALADMKTRAASTASEVRSSFTSAFAETQRLAQQALTLPRTTTGSLNLAPEIKELQAAASAAEQRALALNEMATAAERSALAEGVATEKMMLRADSARVAALAEQQNLAAIRQEITGLETLQTELNRTSSVTRIAANDVDEAAGAHGRMGAAGMMAQHSVRAFADSVAAGQSPIRAFSMEAGRVPEMLSLWAAQTGETSGKLGKLANFLGGPWGLALTLGTAVLTPLVGHLLDGANAADQMAEHQKDLADFIDRTTGRLKEQNVALIQNRQLQTGQDLNTARQAMSASRLRADSLFSVFPSTSSAYSDVLAGKKGSLANLTTTIEGLKKYGQFGVQYIKPMSDALADLVNKGRDLDKLNAQLRILQGGAQPGDRQKAFGDFGSDAAAGTAELIKKQVDLATATTAVERARAAYNLVVARGTEAEKEGGAALDKFRADLTAAKTALNQAEAAQKAATQAKRDDAKATREAAEADKKRQSDVDSLLKKADPYVAWHQQLQDIQAEVLDGHKSIDEGQEAAAEAGRRYGEALIAEAAKALEEGRAQLSGPLQALFSSDWVTSDSLKTSLDRDMQSLSLSLYGRTKPQRETGTYSEVANTLASVSGLRIGSGPSRLLSAIGGGANSNDPFAKGMSDAINPLVNALGGATKSIDGAFADSGTFKKALGELAGGAALGTFGGGAFASITGGKSDKLAESIGGALGEKAGKSLTGPIAKAIGGSLGGTLGNLAGPLGGILGGVLGDVVSGLFTSPQKGGATITSLTGTASTFGNNQTDISAASGAAKGVQQGVQQIADALGGMINGWSPVTIGVYGKDNEWRVNTTGGQTLGGSSSAIPGVDYFGSGDEGQQAAIADAIRIEIENGVISGISAASEKILESGQDLQTAINKALLIEAVPKDLKAALDPVGAAIDALNTKWAKTVAALEEGGATAEQMAQAQQLYNLQLDQTKASTAAADATLQDFKKSLMLGTDSPYSLRDQESTALAALEPYLSAINAGSYVDQSKYQDAAQAYLDVERQLYGSTQQYFDALDQVQAATNKAIATVDNVSSISPDVADPFGSATADNTAAIAQSTAASADLATESRDLLQRIAAAVEGLGSSSTASDFVGAARAF